jgi:hypothetical protein
MFGFEITRFYELEKDGSYCHMAVITKNNIMYRIGITRFHHIGAAPGSEWEIITDENDWTATVASDFISSPEELFVEGYKYTPTGYTFNSFNEMKEFWSKNSIQVGVNGMELVFAIP